MFFFAMSVKKDRRKPTLSERGGTGFEQPSEGFHFRLDERLMIWSLNLLTIIRLRISLDSGTSKFSGIL